jgi:alpha-tubulin suppressor-like RCC1 family protein
MMLHSYGQLGILNATTQFVPVTSNMTLFNNKTIIKVKASTDASMAMTSDGSLFQFGYNQ